MQQRTDNRPDSELTKNEFYVDVIAQHNLRLTRDRVDDFRKTMREIIDVSKGISEPRDIQELDSENYGRGNHKIDKMAEEQLSQDMKTP